MIAKMKETITCLLINSEVPIPEYDWRNGSPEEFYASFVKTPHPVVLRGFMKDMPLLSELTFDQVLSKYGTEEVHDRYYDSSFFHAAVYIN